MSLLSILVSAQKPKWVNNTPVELNKTYKFVEIVSMGHDYTSARADALQLLAQDQQLASAITVNVNTGIMTGAHQTVKNGEWNETVNTDVVINVNVSGEKYNLKAIKVDEYADKNSGQIQLHSLFMVAISDHAVFDRTYLTTSYGMKPVVMSVIPGLGQWYKGSKVKGICMFAAEALAIGGIVLCENERSTYLSKIKDQPNFAKEYKNKSVNWETGRNICIGVAAGIWIYNMIDAAVAKGARRVVVNRADGKGLSIAPMASPESVGFSLAYKFN